MANKPYVQIQSNVTVVVPRDLAFKDLTNHKSDVPNRMKIGATWPKVKITLLKGAHYYPAEVAEWNIIKNMVKDRLVTIGAYSDDCKELDASAQTVVDKNIHELNSQNKQEHAEVKRDRKVKKEAMKNSEPVDHDPSREDKDASDVDELEDIANE